MIAGQVVSLTSEVSFVACQSACGRLVRPQNVIAVYAGNCCSWKNKTDSTSTTLLCKSSGTLADLSP